ncbi:nucleotidyltransferase domain-containing protein [Oscillatoria sp. FACHB-1407]|uniref:nucleotidyltransferase family protein n=1 Tax=Oscillatoria sp. FACHB-1407 TaxID=2692847 RepID=UPI00168463CD|nr:nucleotidyltransferase domain-containing protein [Oscillatoria sp. FACHB-1407]MBD2462380.1 nucleotidyltransferase domain-containing protein [Oscillatoria sp. FACHB-1407]
MTTELQAMMSDRCHVTRSQIIEFCHRWHVIEFAVFGSVLRDDFRDDSDIDVLVTLAPDHGLNLFDWMDMQQELETLFHREVDLVDKRGLKNPYRRSEILNTRQIVYASEQS